MATFISNSPAETEALGRQHAEKLRPGSVLALAGELGSGKTVYVKGIAAGLGSQAEVTSPTFTIVHEYPGGMLPVYHFDFFRVENPEALTRIGLDDYLLGDGVSVIEWADRFPDLLPEKTQWLRFEIQSGNRRAIAFDETRFQSNRPPAAEHRRPPA